MFSAVHSEKVQNKFRRGRLYDGYQYSVLSCMAYRRPAQGVLIHKQHTVLIQIIATTVDDRRLHEKHGPRRSCGFNLLLIFS
jgi:hypothetical protein